MTNRAVLGVVIMWMASGFAGAQEGPGKSYPDGHGGTVFFPLGDISFADEVVSFRAGDPDAGEYSEHPERALDIPDYDGVQGTNYHTLGCGGVMVLAFTDNVLTDITGPDLYIFEIGPNLEPTALAISPDGEVWTRVGVISGGKAEIDIADYVPLGATYRYVKLVDLKQACGGYPGADIDTVGAIGSATKISLDSSVLFDSGKYELKDSAIDALKEATVAVKAGPGVSVVVEGHTDNVGSDEDNLTLSQNRASSVAAFLAEHGGFAEGDVKTEAYGESRPIATNDTDEGRQKNRRVEITILSNPPERTTGEAKIEILGVWDTSQGMMELRREGDVVSGTYDKGRLDGRMVSETVFEGVWVQEHSSQACDELQLDSKYWGAIRFEFDGPARDSFLGSWGYCEGEAETTGWDGERLL